MYFLDDLKKLRNRKGFSHCLYLAFTLGKILFLGRSLIVIVNLSFLIGLCLLIGIRRIFSFFLKKDILRRQIFQGKPKRSVLFFGILNYCNVQNYMACIFDLNIWIIQIFKAFLPFQYDSSTKVLKHSQFKKMVDEVFAKGPSV